MGRAHGWVLVLLCCLTVASVAQGPDFSGSYTLTPPKHASKSTKATTYTLTAVQTANAIVVTRIADGKSTTNTFPLDGGEGIYHTENQTPGTCKGHFKGNELFLESTIVTRPLKDEPVVIIRTKEQWKLSPDLKTLKIHNEVENPRLPISIVDPWTDVYTRD
jgi:hypothetical protein